MNNILDVMLDCAVWIARAGDGERGEELEKARDDIVELMRRHAELEVAAARLAVERAEFRRDREALVEALLLSLPYVTDAEGFPEQFKPGVVKKHVEQIRAALARVQP